MLKILALITVAYKAAVATSISFLILPYGKLNTQPNLETALSTTSLSFLNSLEAYCNDCGFISTANITISLSFLNSGAAYFRAVGSPINSF